ncbi:hypothetical protein [uncultured Anaerovibrio sp.]|uniref:hypothetical protein n=1 Tax=uncultured Anaerovibrio sp. TaxID=361586 RepID=UPI002605C7FC|nr:hypothetical protein [uncultured Anaerovibrio sp.]
MIIKVSKGYVSYKGELYGVGKTIELPDDTAKSLIAQGVVEEAGELPASDIEPIFADEEASEDIDEPEDDDEEETVAELPAVEPEQTISKGSGKGTGKGKGGNTRTKKA